MAVIAEATTRDPRELGIIEYAETPYPANDIIFEDIFDRPINNTGITLVDWEGYMANPALKFFIRPPTNTTFPQTAVLTANGPRLYFDAPSEIGATGPTKLIKFADESDRIPVYLSIFPDRDTLDENYVLTIQFLDALGKQKSTAVNIHVIDQDQNRASPFEIMIDFSHDQTGFFNDPQKQAIVQQAANDWAYFIDDMHLDNVPAGDENTRILNPDNNWHGTPATNPRPYTGFLLYAVGIHTPQLMPGGYAANDFSFQSSNGIPLPLRRSGGIGIETTGCYNTRGWFTGDDDWRKTETCNSEASEASDFYSVIRHEIGHALFFEPAYPLFSQMKRKDYVENAAVQTYHHSYPKTDEKAHFDGAIDQASQRGAFGYEYYGPMAHGRELITKLDLLTAQAIGYKLRPTSAFIPLSIQTASLPSGTRLKEYTTTVQATGGIPTYFWTTESGALPDGLFLDSFTGTITGSPNQTGTFGFTVRVRDNDSTSAGAIIPLSITVID
ncbi:Ig domain-containing protein [Chloroflexota bacterium]